MKIGEDFDKIEFEMFGLDLLEPNALLGDLFLAFVSFVLAFKVSRISIYHPFFKNWKIFFIVFGISFIAGGLGHILYNYWGVSGKSVAWITSILGVYFIEQAMISLYHEKNSIPLFKKLSKLKLVLSWLALTIVFITIDLDAYPQKGMIIPSISTAVGFICCLGILGRSYAKKITKSFSFFWISVVIMLPSVIVQGMKISIYPYLDRNDLSHILLLVMLLLYWKGNKGYFDYLKRQSKEI